MVNKYDNLNYCLKTLYNLVYESTEFFEFKNHILLRDLDDIGKYIKSDQLMLQDRIFPNSDVRRIKKINDSYLLLINHDPYSFRIKITPYKSFIKNFFLPEMNGCKVSYILSEFPCFHRLPFIRLPVMNFNCSRTDILENFSGIGDVPDGTFLVQIEESYFPSVSLKRFIKKSLEIDDWKLLKIVVFQIVFILAKIQELYPSFRHNRLDLENIDVVLYPTANLVKPKYHYRDTKFYVPDTDIMIKLSNFEFASINEITKHRKKENPYFDIFYLFSYLINAIPTRPKEWEDFFELVIPSNIRLLQISEEMEELPVQIKYDISPQKLLESIFFQEYANVVQGGGKDSQKCKIKKQKLAQELEEKVEKKVFKKVMKALEKQQIPQGMNANLFPSYPGLDPTKGSGMRPDMMGLASQMAPPMVSQMANSAIGLSPDIANALNANAFGGRVLQDSPIGGSPKAKGEYNYDEYYNQLMNKLTGNMEANNVASMAPMRALQFGGLLRGGEPTIKEVSGNPYKTNIEKVILGEKKEMEERPEHDPFQPKMEEDVKIKEESKEEEVTVGNTLFDPYAPEVAKELKKKPPPKKQPPAEKTYIAGEPLIDLGLKIHQPKLAPPKKDRPEINIPKLESAMDGINVRNTYNLDLAGPHVDHDVVFRLFEDAYPPYQFTPSSQKLEDRVHTREYLRSFYLKRKDGEMVDYLHGDSFISHLKILDMNPYPNPKSNNPYLGFPKRTLIYKSCFPIMEKNSRAVCGGKNSMPFNIKIMGLTMNEYHTYMSNKDELYKFDIFREIAYYDYLKRTIVSKKQCPNFVMGVMHLFIKNLKINWDALERKKDAMVDRKKMVEIYPHLKQELNLNKLFNKMEKLIDSYKDQYVNEKDVDKEVDEDDPETRLTIPMIELKPKRDSNTINEIDDKERDKLSCNDLEAGVLSGGNALSGGNVNWQRVSRPDGKRTVVIDIDDSGDSADEVIIQRRDRTGRLTSKIPIEREKDYRNPLLRDNLSGFNLVHVTEGATYNIYEWASRKYKAYNGVAHLVNPGYYNEKVWFSVLFQIMVAMYTLQIHNLSFTEFRVEDSILIKDLSINPQDLSYWKYKINGIDYYVPNYGYIVLLNPSSRDLPEEEKDTYKIEGPIFEDPKKFYAKHFKAKSFQMFEKFFSKTTFDNDDFLSRRGNRKGIQPPQAVKEMISLIETEIQNSKKKTIGYYIYKYMRMYNHSRVGSSLRKGEIENVSVMKKEFKRGQLILQETRNDTFRVVMFIKYCENSQAMILTKDNREDTDLNVYNFKIPLKEERVAINSLYGYSENLVDQDFVHSIPGMNEEPLDVYILEEDLHVPSLQ